MTPIKTPTLQAAYDHARTSLDMVNQRLEDDTVGLDAEGLAARTHLIEAVAALNASLAQEAGQTGMDL